MSWCHVWVLPTGSIPITPPSSTPSFDVSPEVQLWTSPDCHDRSRVGSQSRVPSSRREPFFLPVSTPVLRLKPSSGPPHPYFNLPTLDPLVLFWLLSVLLCLSETSVNHVSLCFVVFYPRPETFSSTTRLSNKTHVRNRPHSVPSEGPSFFRSVTRTHSHWYTYHTRALQCIHRTPYTHSHWHTHLS